MAKQSRSCRDCGREAYCCVAPFAPKPIESCVFNDLFSRIDSHIIGIYLDLFLRLTNEICLLFIGGTVLGPTTS